MCCLRHAVEYDERDVTDGNPRLQERSGSRRTSGRQRAISETSCIARERVGESEGQSPSGKT